MGNRRKEASLQRDAAELYEAATLFIRFYQFRNRDQALRAGLTVVQAYTLDILVAGGGSTVTEITETLRLDKSTVSRIIAGMTRKGLVKWSTLPDDRRTKQVVASAEGARRYKQLRTAIIRQNARLLATYSSGARRAIIATFQRLTGRGNSSRAASS